MCISEKRVPRLHRLQPEKMKWNEIKSFLFLVVIQECWTAAAHCLYAFIFSFFFSSLFIQVKEKKQQKQIVLPSIFIIIFMSTHLQTNKPPMLLGCFPHMGKDRMGVRARARTRSKDSKENTNQRQRKPAKCGALGQRCGGRSRQQSQSLGFVLWPQCHSNVVAQSVINAWVEPDRPERAREREREIERHYCRIG